MRVRFDRVLVCGALFCVLFGFASCGPNRVGTIPQGTPDHGNGTPAVIATATQPVAKATLPTTGNYAFVSNNQLWLSLNGASSHQMTHFVYGNTPDVFWHQPLWSAGDHYIAFIMTARPVGQGGGGCPAPDFGANGGLYLLNTATQQLTSITLPSGSASASTSKPVNDMWQYVFWEDATHLLAWYNGPLGQTSTTAGLYRYDLNTQTLTQVLPLSALGATTLFSAQPNLPLLASMRYSNEQLLYQIIVHPFEQHSSFVIYSHSVASAATPATKVAEMGSESWCTTQQSAANMPYMQPGWDVSADGEQLALQVVTAANTTGLSSIQVIDLKDSLATPLFTQAPSQLFGHDLSLAWGPDSQTLVVTTTGAQDQSGLTGSTGSAGSMGLYSATLANPAASQHYAPALSGQVAWRPDSSAFALTPSLTVGATGRPNVYLFNTGNAQGRLLLADAQNFVWG